MPQMIPMKELYGNLKKVGDAVESWTTFIVLKHSKPVYRITPIVQTKEKKYNIDDIDNFVYKSDNKETDLALNYKKYIY